jgi:hypothetical protein
MTRAAAPAARSALPSPCGRGVGGGGRLHDTPRPGPQPGLRPAPGARPRLRALARTGAIRTGAILRYLVSLALALPLVTPAAAQIVPTGVPAADILLTRALGEQRIFLTCSALDGEAHRRIRQDWDRDVAAALATLSANTVPADAIAAFTEAARVETLMPSPDTPWSEVRQLCDATPDWPSRTARRSFTILALTLPPVFE